jgi:hypothetical protein
MKKIVAIAALAAALGAPVALAGEQGSMKTFAEMDTDANGALSLSEIQAVKPDVTAEKVAKYDTDASGELSEAELEAWKAAKKADKDAAGETPAE